MVYWVDLEHLVRAPDPVGPDAPPAASSGTAKGGPAGASSPAEKQSESPWSSIFSQGLLARRAAQPTK